MGAALDFQTHHGGIGFAEEGFLTHSHVLIYAMVLGLACVIGGYTARNRGPGDGWRQAIPPGYGWGLLGLGLFWLGGLGDVWWHVTFGYERGTEGLLSPSHLVLLSGAVILVATPLRAAWQRDPAPRGRALLPAIISAGLVFSLFALFGGWVNPLAQPHPTPTIDSNTGRMIGVSGLLLFSLFMLGGAQALARRFRLPVGALTVILSMPAVATALVWGTEEFIPAVAVTGLVADTLVRWRRPTLAAAGALRVFGSVLPVVFVGSYMGVVAWHWHLAWTVHVWVGTIVAAGLVGLTLTYAILPTAAPTPSVRRSRDGPPPSDS